MADTDSRDIARADYLRGLAMRPKEALSAWRQLTSSEQFLVITQMAMYYDFAFVRAFQTLAGKHVQPNVEITITNAPRNQHTPQTLRAAGFGLQPGGAGGTQYWVHPTGRQVWLIAPPRALPPPSLFSDPISPIVADADPLGEADELIRRYRSLEQKAGEIKRRRISRNQSPKEYYDSCSYWWQDHITWKRNCDSFQSQLGSTALSRLTPVARAQAQQRMQEIQNLMEARPEALLEPLEAIKPR